MRLVLGDFTFTTPDPVEIKKAQAYNRWSFRIPKGVWNVPYQSIAEMDRVIVQLLAGDKPICFWHGLATDFVDPNPAFKHIPL